jgi:hypothetical protein
MHACLTEENATYAYPEMTLQELTEFKKYIPEDLHCKHDYASYHTPGCEVCEKKVDEYVRLTKIKEQLEDNNEGRTES